MYCWALMGTTGMNEDCVTWITGVFASWELAKERLDMCKAWAKEAGVLQRQEPIEETDDLYLKMSREALEKVRCPHDPVLNVDVDLEGCGVDWDIEQAEYHDDRSG